jgi:hypothetical protein
VFWETTVALIKQAHEAGKRTGKVEAADELRNKLVGVLTAPTEISESSEADRRAPRGSVRPAVIGALIGYGEPGLRVNEIAIRTGVNENSVRGMLNTLREEGLAVKDGDLWKPAQKNESRGNYAPAQS